MFIPHDSGGFFGWGFLSPHGGCFFCSPMCTEGGSLSVGFFFPRGGWGSFSPRRGCCFFVRHAVGGFFCSPCGRRFVFWVGFFFPTRLVGFYCSPQGGWVFFFSVRPEGVFWVWGFFSPRGWWFLFFPQHRGWDFLFFPTGRVVWFFSHAAGEGYFVPTSQVVGFFPPAARGGFFGRGFFSPHGGCFFCSPMWPEGFFLGGVFFSPHAAGVFILFSPRGGWVVFLFATSRIGFFFPPCGRRGGLGWVFFFLMPWVVSPHTHAAGVFLFFPTRQVVGFFPPVVG